MCVIGDLVYYGNRSIVVESEPLLRESLIIQLETFGFAVTATGNADEALEVMRAAPDMRLMVVDSNVSGQTGALELATIARSMAPNLRVVIASGVSNSPLVAQAAGSEWTLIKKPFSWSEFGSAIGDTLSA